jgi:hypothetical protein
MALKITVSRPEVWVSSAVLHCEGALDHGNYRALVELALDEIDKGAADLTVDLSEVTSINLAGVVGVYLIGLLLEEDPLFSASFKLERDWRAIDGWDVLHQYCAAVNQEKVFSHIQLLVPNQQLMDQITSIGLNRLMQVLPKFGGLDEMAKFL